MGFGNRAIAGTGGRGNRRLKAKKPARRRKKEGNNKTAEGGKTDKEITSKKER